MRAMAIMGARGLTCQPRRNPRKPKPKAVRVARLAPRKEAKRNRSWVGSPRGPPGGYLVMWRWQMRSQTVVDIVSPISTQRRKGKAKSRLNADADEWADVPRDISIAGGSSSDLLYPSPGPSRPARRTFSQGLLSSSVASGTGSLPDESAQGSWHRQMGTCLQLKKDHRQADVSQYTCVHCRRHQAGDSCRFVKLRELRRVGGKLVEARFVSNEEDEGEIKFLTEWNIEPEGHHLNRIKRVVAKALLPTLRYELEHVRRPGMIRRPREMKCRATCDLCMTSIFSGCWMCKVCGRELCGECYDILCEYSSETAEASAKRRARLSPAEAEAEEMRRYRLMVCRGRTECHPVEMWIPVSRFRPGELEETIRDMEKAVKDGDEDDTESAQSLADSMQGIGRLERALKSFEKEAEREVGAESSQLGSRLVEEVLVGDRLERLGKAVKDGEETTKAEGVVDGEPFQHSSTAMEGIQVREELDAGPAPSSPARIPSYAWPLPEVADNRMAFLDEALTWGWHWRGDETADSSHSSPNGPSTALSSQSQSESALTVPTSPSSSVLPDPNPNPNGLDALPIDPSGVPSLAIKTFADDELTEEIFRSHWSTGQPMVVTGLLPKFEIEWTPQYFIDHYGTEECEIVDCQTNTVAEKTVGEFFSMFGVYGKDRAIHKLKDWPPQADFKTAFPELYQDFSRAVPIPNYTRRDGVLNIAAHFPVNAVAPDIGPKMYNAFESDEGPGGQGSTRLHMDMADAVNIMLYAARRGDGTAGTAAWDIFRAEDAGKIRQFLKAKFPESNVHDPIHSQVFYLDSELRRQLYDEYGVASWRIYQRPGEAVFIPAGCAHQVCNLADCIKVAVDFVSPENVNRCEGLTREFRQQNQAQAWKEDVLQLRSMMWYAWLSCNRTEKSRASADSVIIFESDGDATL
ncbi:hypothetical protein BOTBODRAFT_408594 [Botryobasidium botryosum FD-172 SS1]|uniref:JmjC domain-containing protein n=1 Tax=Botryobasidium botryosum (strain FD-172 SS1) TaxID=930990 RepID=A0A067MAV1_BOTB1|nr:hypothetical protein BOTBODRAFT_408594 [Botryobasidium botryosum FD-172 SS1]